MCRRRSASLVQRQYARTFTGVRAEQPVRGPAGSLDGGEIGWEDFGYLGTSTPTIGIRILKKEIRGRLRRKYTTRIHICRIRRRRCNKAVEDVAQDPRVSLK